MDQTRKTLLMLICIFLMLKVNAQTDQTFTLSQAQQYALEHNIETKNAELDNERSKKDVSETLARGLPQINASANLRKNFDIQTNIITFGGEETEIKFGTEYNAEASINASQLLFDGTFFVGLRASRTYVELSTKKLEQTELETRINIAKAYYMALLASKNYEVLKQSVQQTKNSLDETKAYFKNGFVEELDVDRLQLTLNNLKTKINGIERDREVAYQLLKFQMGYPLKDTIILADKLESYVEDQKISESIIADFDVTNRIEYKILKVEEDLAYLNISQYRSTYLPKMNLFAAHSQMAMRNEFNFFDGSEDWFPATYAGIQLDVPIFQGFGRGARVQKAKIDLQKLQNQKENLENSLELEVTRSRNNYNTALENLQNQEENLNLSKKIYDRTKIKYKEGVGSSLETNTALNDYLMAQSNYFNTLYDYLIAKINLEKALANY